MFDIDKNAKEPSALDSKLRVTLESLDLNDSFFIPEGEYSVSTIRTTITRAHKNTSKTFTSRKQEGGMRIWRVE